MTGQRSYGLDWLDAACDWAKYRKVPIDVWRNEEGHWCVGLTFRDLNGLFRSDPLPMPEQVTKSALGKVESKLEKLCVQARKGRSLLNAV